MFVAAKKPSLLCSCIDKKAKCFKPPQIVFGEVYDVDDQCLQWLDDFEGHPHHYERDRVKVRILSRVTDNNETDSKSSESERDTDYCWVYYLKKFDSSLLLLESYSSYDAYGKHNRTYVYQYVKYFYIVRCIILLQ